MLYVDTARIAREECSSPDLIVRMQGIVLLGAVLTMFGLIHSVDLAGGIYLPWQLSAGAQSMTTTS